MLNNCTDGISTKGPVKDGGLSQSLIGTVCADAVRRHGYAQKVGEIVSIPHRHSMLSDEILFHYIQLRLNPS